MNKILKNVGYILIVIIMAMLILDITYSKFGYGYFSKAATIKDTTSFTRDSNVKYSNDNSYKIENKDYNNSAFYKKVKVKKNTPYKVTCMVKTENVELLDNTTSNCGAQINILDSWEQSKCVTGTNNWTEVSILFNSKQNEEVQIGFMLGGDTENGNVKGTAWFSNLKIEEGNLDSDNNWNCACFIFKNVDVNLNGKQYKYKMSIKDVEEIYNCVERFKNTCSEYSNNLMNISYDIIEIDESITNLSYDEVNGYYIDGTDISNKINQYLDKKEYDHIFVCTRLSDEKSKIPMNDWIGLGSMEYEGIGYSNIRMPTSSTSNQFVYNEKYNQFPEEVFVHEFLHTLERNSGEYGYEVPVLHENLKYAYIQDKVKSLSKWYKDYMGSNINYNGKNVGINSDVYSFKPVHESNFEKSKVLTDFEDPENIVEKTKVLINTIKKIKR